MLSACLRIAALGVAVLAVLAVGCGGGTPAPLTVSWRLIDGRSCFEAGVVLYRFSLTGGAISDSAAMVRCSRDPAQQQVTLAGALPGARLLAEGVSASEGALYRAEVELPEPLPAVQEVVLGFAGGQ